MTKYYIDIFENFDSKTGADLEISIESEGEGLYKNGVCLSNYVDETLEQAIRYVEQIAVKKGQSAVIYINDHCNKVKRQIRL